MGHHPILQFDVDFNPISTSLHFLNPINNNVKNQKAPLSLLRRLRHPLYPQEARSPAIWRSREIAGYVVARSPSILLESQPTPHRALLKTRKSQLTRPGLTGFTDEQIASLFREAFKKESKLNPNYGRATGMTPTKWWTNVRCTLFLTPISAPYFAPVSTSLSKPSISNIAFPFPFPLITFLG